MKEGAAYLAKWKGEEKQRGKGLELRLRSGAGRGSPQESVKQGVSVKREKGTIPAVTRAGELRLGQAGLPTPTTEPQGRRLSLGR